MDLYKSKFSDGDNKPKYDNEEDSFVSESSTSNS